VGFKKNIAYNIALTLSSYLIGIITFPYISRVLGVANIGIVSFVDSTINYFVLFSTLGAAVIGTREISKYKNDKVKLNAVFSSLIIIYSIYTLIVVVVYFLAVTFIDKLNIHQELFFIGIAKLIFSVFLIEWLYKGLENFKYITTRTLIIKICYVISLFIFVNSREDYKIYFLLTTITVVVNASINILYSKKLVKFSFAEISLKPYFKQSFYLGSYSLLTSMYTTFNIMYLGFVSDKVQVGYYWAALTLYSALLGFFSAFTSAMMPRMSALHFSGNKEIFNKLIHKSINILFALSLPIMIGAIMLAPQIIRILSGPGFEGAIIPMQIIMPLVLIIGIAQVLAIQVLIPMQKDNLILFASFIGAITGIILNVILVKKLEATGTAIVLLCSELAVTVFYIYAIWKNNILVFPWRLLVKNLFFASPYIIICFFFLKVFNGKNVLILVSSVTLSMLYFSVLNIFIIKNTEIITLVKSLKTYLTKH